jgi:hypothetical protein
LGLLNADFTSLHFSELNLTERVPDSQTDRGERPRQRRYMSCQAVQSEGPRRQTLQTEPRKGRKEAKERDTDGADTAQRQRQRQRQREARKKKRQERNGRNYTALATGLQSPHSTVVLGRVKDSSSHDSTSRSLPQVISEK